MELVSVQYEFEYTAKDGRLVSIKPKELYILVSKTNEHWWHVRKDEHSRPFYVPAQYVKEISSPTEGSPGPNKPDSTECVTESKPVDIDTAQHKATAPTCVPFKDASRKTYRFSTFGLCDNIPDPNPCETLREGQTTSSLAPTMDKVKTVHSTGGFSVNSAPLKANGLDTKPPTEIRQHQSEISLQDDKTEQPQIFVEDVDINLPLSCNSPIYDTIPELNIPQSDTSAELPIPVSSNNMSPSQQHSLNQTAETPSPTHTLSPEQVENESLRSAVYVNVAQLRQSISESPPSAASPSSPSYLSQEGWEVHFDQESRQEYYYHPATGRTTWDCPFLDSPTDPEPPCAEEVCSPSSPQSFLFSPSSPPVWTSDWEQLVDETSGRPYFYNPMSGETSWEPPEPQSPYPPLMEPMSVHRFHEDGPPPLPAEDYPSEDYPAADQQESYEDLHATGPPTLPKEYAFIPVNRTIIPRANLDRSAPTGWNRTVEPNGTWVFTSEHSADEWIQSVDERGQTYYYLRDGSKSQWNLPEAPVAPGHSRVENGVETESVSVFKNWRHTVGPAQFNPAQDDGRFVQSHRRNASDYSSDSSSTGNSPETQPNVQNLEKAGILNKTKVSENGKKVRKNWAQTWTVLHGGVLTFHKDPKSAATGASNKTNQIVPEVTVELKGATICWASKDKSSKKNVLELKGKNGMEFLIQYDTESIISDWHKVLMDTIRQLEYQDHHSEEEDGDLYEKIPNTERDDKRKSLRPSSTPSSSSAGDTDQKKVRTKLMKLLMKRPTLQSVKEKGYIRDNVFGCHLATLCAQERNTVPSFVDKCINAVERRGLDIDGLYRVSGNLAVIQKLRFKADHEELDLEDGQWEDVHVITGALKLFFRELPEPLFPFSHFNEFIDAIKISDGTTKFNHIQSLVKSLPHANHDTMKRLFGHLRRVIKYGENNRMTVQNVAIVFGPTLLRPEMESSNIAVHMVCQNQIVEFILNHYERIFSS
ncbi:rho GTPase-activating protein 12 [Mastacembelus armatus]|uniref:Rho GTPase activating protein 27 n=1 Tax=Mastacembelus armatus TaxID=205130 RepID=A0A3Q3RQ99_9TELE|nr:rho GTPase-activating protein 12-like [Mastacembelus armatus]XP_026171479.1 rho GTPase-activating protein 12-like [Mastacembelus armatus]